MNTPDKKPDRQPKAPAGGTSDFAAEVDLEYTDEWLSAYLDDELSAEQRTIVEQRLVADTEAAELLKDLERVRGLVGSLPVWMGNNLPLALPSGLPADSSAAEASEMASGSDELPATPQAEEPRIEGDYHNELQPAVHSMGHPAGMTQPASIHPQTLETLANPRKLSPTGFSGWATTWAPFLSLAATVLLAVGVGWYLFDQVESRSVATSSGASGIAGPSAAERISESASDMQAESLVEAAQAAQADQADQAVAEPATTSTFDFSSAARGRGQASPESGRVGSEAADGLSAPGGGVQAKAIPRSAPTGTTGRPDLSVPLDPSSSASVDAFSLPAAPLGALSAPPSPAARPLLLAHSSAWTSADIRDGLARLAPLLNISVPVNESAGSAIQGADIQASTLSADAPTKVESEAFPVAMVAREKANGDGSQLVSLLTESDLGLEGLRNGSNQSFLADSVALAADSDSPATTVALFVTLGQAEKILERLREAGEISGSRVWITAAAAANQPLVAAQKVVVVLTPK
jgi:hypothetical protein